MSTSDDQRIKWLISRVLSGGHEELDELMKIYGHHIDKTIKKIRWHMNNNNYMDLASEARTALFLAITRYDERKHKNAFYYLGNFVRDELRRIARQDRDNAFPGIPLSQDMENDDEQEPLGLVENSAVAVKRDPEPNPEGYMNQVDVQEKIAEYRKSLKKLSKRQKRANNKLKVFDDLIQHPDDQFLRSIERRTGISKTTVSTCKTKILKELAEIFRTDYAWVALLRVS